MINIIVFYIDIDFVFYGEVSKGDDLKFYFVGKCYYIFVIFRKNNDIIRFIF